MASFSLDRTELRKTDMRSQNNLLPLRVVYLILTTYSLLAIQTSEPPLSMAGLPRFGTKGPSTLIQFHTNATGDPRQLVIQLIQLKNRKQTPTTATGHRCCATNKRAGHILTCTLPIVPTYSTFPVYLQYTPTSYLHIYTYTRTLPCLLRVVQYAPSKPNAEPGVIK